MGWTKSRDGVDKEQRWDGERAEMEFRKRKEEANKKQGSLRKQKNLW